MPYPRTCDYCGAAFTAARPSGRWCGSRCKTAGGRALRGGRPLPAASPTLPAEPTPGPVHAAVTRWLSEAGASSSPLAASAVALALRIDNAAADPAAGVAAASRELRQVLADLRLEVPEAQDDPISMLRRRRAIRRREARQAPTR